MTSPHPCFPSSKKIRPVAECTHSYDIGYVYFCHRDVNVLPCYVTCLKIQFKKKWQRRWLTRVIIYQLLTLDKRYVIVHMLLISSIKQYDIIINKLYKNILLS